MRQGAAQGEPAAGAAWSLEQDRLLTEWHKRVWASQSAHYSMATALRARNLWLGMPVVVLSTLVGTSLFATLSNSHDPVAPQLRLLVGCISVAAAVLAALQTFLRFSARSEQHTLAADWYSSLRRDLEEVLATPPTQRDRPVPTLDRLRKEMNKIGSQAPMIGERVWLRCAEAYGVTEPALGGRTRVRGTGRRGHQPPNTPRTASTSERPHAPSGSFSGL